MYVFIYRECILTHIEGFCIASWKLSHSNIFYECMSAPCEGFSSLAEDNSPLSSKNTAESTGRLKIKLTLKQALSSPEKTLQCCCFLQCVSHKRVNLSHTVISWIQHLKVCDMKSVTKSFGLTRLNRKWDECVYLFTCILHVLRHMSLFALVISSKCMVYSVRYIMVKLNTCEWTIVSWSIFKERMASYWHIFIFLSFNSHTSAQKVIYFQSTYIQRTVYMFM